MSPDRNEDVRRALVRAAEQAVRLLLGAELSLLSRLEHHVPQVAVPGDPLATNATADGLITVHVAHHLAVGGWELPLL